MLSIKRYCITVWKNFYFKNKIWIFLTKHLGKLINIKLFDYNIEQMLLDSQSEIRYVYRYREQQVHSMSTNYWKTTFPMQQENNLVSLIKDGGKLAILSWATGPIQWYYFMNRKWQIVIISLSLMNLSMSIWLLITVIEQFCYMSDLDLHGVATLSLARWSQAQLSTFKY